MRILRSFAIVAGLSLSAGCAPPDRRPHLPSFSLTSRAFANGSVVPKMMTCDGVGTSPDLEWGGTPRETASLALIARDEDSPLPMVFGHFVHWVVYGLPAGDRRIVERLTATERLANGARQGMNGFGKLGYGGPCPPGGATHRYVFTMYALDVTLALAAGAPEKVLLDAMKGHIIATAELVGHYH